MKQLVGAHEKQLADLQHELADGHCRALERIQGEHEELMRALLLEQEAMRLQHAEAMRAIRTRFEEDAAIAELAFIKEQQVLGREKAEFVTQRDSLRARLESSAVPECGDCTQRRAAIARLQKKRGELQARCDELSKEALVSDARMASLFPKRVGARTSLAVSPKPAPQVTRPVSTMRRSVIAPG